MELHSLAALLEKRLAIIADHGLREREPAEQLRQLQEISEAITAAHQELRPQIDPKLNHYLIQASYEKALAHLRQRQS
jgi:hypothetical protein